MRMMAASSSPGVKFFDCVVTILAGLFWISGCAHLESRDPFGTTSQVPPSPSARYVSQKGGPSWGDGLKEEESSSKELGAADRGHMPKDLGDRELSLADCIRIALETNPQTRSAWQAVRSSAARVGQEKAAYLPEADLEAAASRQKQITAQSIQVDQPAKAVSVFDAVVGVSYLLFDGGQRSARVGGAQADLQALGFQHNAILQDVALRVAQYYYVFLATSWSLQVAEENVRNTEYHVRLSRARFENGLVPRSDVLKAETQKADAGLALVSARNAVRISEGALVSAMGLKVSTPVNIMDIPESTHPRESEEMGQLLEEAMKNRPELLAAVSKVKSKEAAVQEARSQYWPKISAIGAYGWIDDSLLLGNNQWGIGLGLSVPLFTGFKRGYQVERARRDTEQAKADYDNQLRGVELEVWTAYSKLTETAEAIPAAQIFVASAEESARLAEGEYKAGTGNIISMIDAQTALTSARNRLIQARFAWYTARAQFERAVGRSLTADVGLSMPDFGSKESRHVATEVKN